MGLLTDRANFTSHTPGHLAHQVRQSVPLLTRKQMELSMSDRSACALLLLAKHARPTLVFDRATLQLLLHLLPKDVGGV